MKTQNDRCAECANAVPCVSENGFQGRCVLSTKRAANCLTGKKDAFVSKQALLWLMEEAMNEND